MPALEIVRPWPKPLPIEAVLFDFDGTLSLLREGWPLVMMPMMVEELQRTPTQESEADLRRLVEEFVMRLNGRQTIYQMLHLVEEIKQRGGQPLEALQYKHEYQSRLLAKIAGRRDALAQGTASAEDWTVPGSHALLTALQARGKRLYLASGTDEQFVREEADLLQLTAFFGEHIYGARDDYWNFSKAKIIQKMLIDHRLQGEQLLGFGDGFVEIEEIKRIGGLAIGVASDEVHRGQVNEWKRERLLRAGADAIIPDYRDAPKLVEALIG